MNQPRSHFMDYLILLHIYPGPCELHPKYKPTLRIMKNLPLSPKLRTVSRNQYKSLGTYRPIVPEYYAHTTNTVLLMQITNNAIPVFNASVHELCANFGKSSQCEERSFLLGTATSKPFHRRQQIRYQSLCSAWSAFHVPDYLQKHLSHCHTNILLLAIFTSSPVSPLGEIIGLSDPILPQI